MKILFNFENNKITFSWMYHHFYKKKITQIYSKFININNNFKNIKSKQKF